MIYKILIIRQDNQFILTNEGKDIEFTEKRKAEEFKYAIQGIYKNIFACKEVKVIP